MRLLRINGEIADIDEDTAIGIDLQAYDFKDPGKLKVNVSNTFSLPATAKNMRILGSPGNPSRMDNTIYQRINIDYQVRNTLYIKQGAARITSIKEGRINLFVAERVTVIDAMKEVKFIDFVTDWFNNQIHPTFTTFQELADFYADKDSGIALRTVYSQSSDAISEAFGYGRGAWKYLTGIGTVVTEEDGGSLEDNSFGGHFVVYINSLFDHIEAYFGGALFSRTGASYTIFQDSIFNKLYISFQNIQCSLSALQLEFLQPTENIALSYKDLTLYDFFDTTLKLLGYGIEVVNEKIDFVRLDLMHTVPSSGDLLPGYPESDYQFKNEYIPSIDGYGIQSIIKMKVASGVDELTGAKIIQSDNQNLQAKKDLFTINALIPEVLKVRLRKSSNTALEVVYPPILRDYSSFCFMLDKGPQKYIVGVYKQIRTTGSWDDVDTGEGNYAITNVYLPEIYSVASEYNFLDNILKSPESYKIKRWVTASQLEGFRKIAPYYVPELGRWVFVNKIKGFNPVKSKQPVEFELIKVPWQRMPQLPEKPIEISDRWIFESGYWDDGGIWKDSENWAFN